MNRENAVVNRNPKILTANDFRLALGESLQKAQNRALLISAYITTSAVNWIAETVNPDLSVLLMARWTYSDMVSGSSDFQSYWKAREFGFRFFVDPKLHTKAYVFDRTHVFLGSSNLTSRGLWLMGKGNEERVTMVNPAIEDIESLESLVDQAIELNDSLVKEMEKAIVDKSWQQGDWPPEIQDQLEKPVTGLWVTDLLFCGPESLLACDCFQGDLKRDLATLSVLENNLSSPHLRTQFKRTKVYAWLITIVRDEGNVRFGRLSSALHNVLLDSPAPYRREVKMFVKLLFEWVDFLEGEHLVIHKHRHTSSIQWKE